MAIRIQVRNQAPLALPSPEQGLRHRLQVSETFWQDIDLSFFLPHRRLFPPLCLMDVQNTYTQMRSGHAAFLWQTVEIRLLPCPSLPIRQARRHEPAELQ